MCFSDQGLAYEGGGWEDPLGSGEAAQQAAGTAALRLIGSQDWTGCV